jgi:oligo-1,6-glucosidase
MPLVPLKENLTKWQKGLDGVAWNSLFFCNHDQPRVINRLGDPSDEYREVSAKCIATCLHMMQGTPYVYQGEELGMTNYPFRSVKDFNDLESINAYYELTEKMGWKPSEIFPKIANKSRDNARTPMQWDDSPNAGFTTGRPWLAVNPNYTKINAAEQVMREDSVFSYYKKLIELRHSYDIIVYGHYELLLAEDPELYVYTRELDGKKLLVVCNFSDHEREFMPDEEFRDGKVLIRNLDNNNILDGILEPYEAYVLYTG